MKIFAYLSPVTKPFTITVRNTDPNSKPIQARLRVGKKVNVFKAYVTDKRYRDKRKYIQLQNILTGEFSFVGDIYEATVFVDHIDYNPTRALYALVESNKIGKKTGKLICGWCFFDGTVLSSAF